MTSAIIVIQNESGQKVTVDSFQIFNSQWVPNEAISAHEQILPYHKITGLLKGNPPYEGKVTLNIGGNYPNQIIVRLIINQDTAEIWSHNSENYLCRHSWHKKQHLIIITLDIIPLAKIQAAALENPTALDIGSDYLVVRAGTIQKFIETVKNEGGRAHQISVNQSINPIKKSGLENEINRLSKSQIFKNQKKLVYGWRNKIIQKGGMIRKDALPSNPDHALLDNLEASYIGQLFQEGNNPNYSPNDQLEIKTQVTMFPPPQTADTVFDISHWNTPAGQELDFQKAKAAGMQAVIHKLTDGISTKIDPTYQKNKEQAISAGLLWGAYHFGEADNGEAQANNFLSNLDQGKGTLMVLDLERGKNESMSIAEAEAFVNTVQQKTGKMPVLYGGSYLKELMNANPDSSLTQCTLWLAQYGSRTVLPKGFSNWAFWQYTDGENGPNPQPVPGIGHCDRDLYNTNLGSIEDFWQLHSS